MTKQGQDGGVERQNLCEGEELALTGKNPTWTERQKPKSEKSALNGHYAVGPDNWANDYIREKLH